LETFYTDVIKLDPRFHSAKPIGDLNLLEPTTRDLVRQIIHDAATLGFELMAFETYRSQERQEELFNQHATQLKKVGVHHYGLACDLVKLVGGAPSWKGDFTFLGRLAYQHKLIWGGDWGTPKLPHKSFDAVHVQRCSVARQAALFRGEWYPEEDYDPYEDLDGVNETVTLMASAAAEYEHPSPFNTLRAGSVAQNATRTTRFPDPAIWGGVAGLGNPRRPD